MYYRTKSFRPICNGMKHNTTHEILNSIRLHIIVYSRMPEMLSGRYYMHKHIAHTHTHGYQQQHIRIHILLQRKLFAEYVFLSFGTYLVYERNHIESNMHISSRRFAVLMRNSHVLSHPSPTTATATATATRITWPYRLEMWIQTTQARDS